MADNLADLSMLDLLRMEVETHVAPLERGLLALESAQAPRDKIEPLMRAAHSIKGAGRILGLAQVVTLAHAMEDVFVAAQEGRLAILPELVDLLLQAVDVFKRLAAQPPATIPAWLQEQEATMGSMTDTLRAVLAAPQAATAVALQTPAAVAPQAPMAVVPQTPPAAAPTVAPAEIAVAVPPAAPRAPRGTRTQAAPPKPAPAPAPAATPAPAHAPVPAEPGARSPARAEGEIAAEVVTAAAPARAEEGVAESAVLVASHTLNRLLGLASESLVAMRGLDTLVQELRRLKTGQLDLATGVGRLREGSSAFRRDPLAQALVADLAGALEEQQHRLAQHSEAFESFVVRAGELSSRLYDAAVATRMRPFSDGVVGFPRYVRDLARQLGKKISLQIHGETVRVDRDMLARLEAPLNHLLRNACDHGIEPPDERATTGKSAEAVIHLEASHRAGMLLITVSDDGRGIDVEKIRSRIIEKGLADAGMAGRMSEAELLEFLFLPGFSTAGKVTEISGRGVGLDVVHTMVQEVGGTLQVTSRPGHGATFALVLPLTLSVVRALLVQIAGEGYAFPLTRLDRVLVPALEEIRHVEGRPFLDVDGSALGLIPASQPLGLRGLDAEAHEPVVVVISDRLNRYGVVVDRLLGERELVVRPLDPILGKVPNIAAAAILEDGVPVLILDVDDLVRSIDAITSSGRPEDIAVRGELAVRTAVKHVLVVDDSITVREVERRLLANSGYVVDVAVDGMDGWNRVRGGGYDLVITDVDMPRMNGIELVTHLKGDPQLRAMPVMIVSYKDREEDRRRGLEAGANYYLTKSSFHDDTLLGAVVDLIGPA
jgi:two-component system, chemotaxis family, sensor histidine kinase and response regulator WspE